MHQIYEHFLTLMTWWFHNRDLFQNEVMPLLHGSLQLFVSKLKPQMFFQCGTKPQIIISLYNIAWNQHYFWVPTETLQTFFNPKWIPIFFFKDPSSPPSSYDIDLSQPSIVKVSPSHNPYYSNFKLFYCTIMFYTAKLSLTHHMAIPSNWPFPLIRSNLY